MIYSVAFCLALPTYIDEAYTYNLAADHSLWHVLSALRNGADGTFPVFGILVFIWEKVFGSSEFSLRLTSALFAVLLVGHLSSRLARWFKTIPVALALLLILANKNFLLYVIQARFYGLLLFAFSLVFWSTWDLIENRSVSRPRWLGHALFCGLLWLSHPLGMIYGSILVILYAGFSTWRNTLTWVNLAAFLGGPLCFLLWLPSFLVQRKINVVFPAGAYVGGWSKYGEYAFLDSNLFFLGMCLLGIVLLVAERLKRLGLPTGAAPPPNGAPQNDSRRQLVLYALAFIVALNLVVALLDATGVVDVYLLAAKRYVLVAVVGYSVIFSAILEKLDLGLRRGVGSWWSGTVGVAHQVLIALLLLLVLGSRWSEARRIRSIREAYYGNVARLALKDHRAILCENHIDAFYLSTRTSAADVKYLLPDDFPFRTLMLQNHAYYPQPTPLSGREFQQYSQDHVLVRFNSEVIVKPPAPPAP